MGDPNDGYERLKTAIFDGILDEGFVIQYLATGVAFKTPRAYTVGRSMINRPEFIVTGLDREESEDLLRELVAIDGDRHLDVGHQLRWKDLEVAFVRAEPLSAPGAYATFGGCTVMQAYWRGPRTEDQPLLTPGSIPLLPDTDPYGDR